jgi:hypothetical protein
MVLPAAQAAYQVRGRPIWMPRLRLKHAKVLLQLP